VTVRAIFVPEESAHQAPPGTLLAASLAGSEMTVRNWRPGDRYLPANSRSEEKLKRLFSERKIPESERTTWPVVVVGEKIVWVRGFPVAQAYAWRTGMGDALQIEELS
jgi:tRNA(Ile)-lysidine synthetase-like protein